MSKIIKDFDELQEQAFLGYGDLYIAVAKIAWQARQPEIEALKADSTRLEWMMNNGAYVAYSMDGEVCHVRMVADRGEDEYPAEGYPLKVYDDRRQAIDMAMKVK